ARAAGRADEGDDGRERRRGRRRDGPAGHIGSLPEGRGIYREGCCRGRDAARRRARGKGGAAGRWIFPRSDDFRPRDARDDDRAGGDFRAGAVGDPGGDARRGDRAGERLAVRQCDGDLHAEREVGAGVLVAMRGRDGRGEYRGSRADGVLSVRGLEVLIFRGLTCAWEGRGRVLYGAKGGYEPLVLTTTVGLA